MCMDVFMHLMCLYACVWEYVYSIYVCVYVCIRAQIYLHPGQITAVIIKFSFYYQFVGRFRHYLKKKKKSTSELFLNQFPHFANILTTVNLLQWCHLQNFPISRKPVPPSPIITGDSLQISCGQTAYDVLAKICALWVFVCVCRIFF